MTRLLASLLAIALASLWFFLLRPGFLGGAAGYVIVSGGSMEPTLYTGDLVVTRKEANYQPGDIVAFRVEGGIVIHRIVGGSAAEGFIVRGDNKDAPDRWRPKPNEIVGRQWLHLPSAGRSVAALREPRRFAALIGGLAAFAILPGAMVLKATRHRRRRRRHYRDLAYAEFVVSQRR
jgi:signal peptidase